MNKRFLLLSLLLSLSSFVYFGCIFTENVEGRSSLQLVPDIMLNQMAASAYADQKKELPTSTSTTQNELVNQVAQRLIQQCEKLYPEQVKGFQWEVTLFEAPDVPNAYAMPGGKIGVYTGILPICENEAGLAAVLGHEVGHAILRHGGERVSQGLVAQGVIKGTEITLSGTQIYQQYPQVVGPALGAAIQVGVLLPFSRANESESDGFGTKLMAAAGYDPAAAVRVWENMKARGGEAPPEYLSTHPSNDRRIQDLTAMQSEAQAIYQKAPQKYGMGEPLK